MSTTTLGEPVELSRESTRDHWNTVIASTVGWSLDSFDYFVVVMVLTEIANEFHRTNAEIALTLTITLAFRPIGAFIFGLLADRYGRRMPLMIDVVAYSILSVVSVSLKKKTSLRRLRRLLSLASRGDSGVVASLDMAWDGSRGVWLCEL